MYSFILLNRIGISIPFKDIPFDGVSNPGLPSYLFLWGVAKRMETYQTRPDKQTAFLPESSNIHSNERQEALKS